MTGLEHKRGVQTPGPVQRQPLAELRSEFGVDFGICLSNRSPLGKRAFRLQVCTSKDSGQILQCEVIAKALRRKTWIESALSTQANIYVRPTAEALQSWCAPAWADSQPRGIAEQVIVCSRPVQPFGTGSLRSYRAAVIARAVVAQLRSIGLHAGLCPENENGHRPDDTARVITVGVGPQDDAKKNIAVGSVDVEHGTLRARCGGSISLQDFRALIQGEINRNSLQMSNPAIDLDIALRFILARAERKQHLRISQQRLMSDIATYGTIVEATRVLREGQLDGPPRSLDDKADGAVAELILELELLPWVADQTAAHFEPAIVLRYVANLTRRVRDASPRLNGQHDVTAAAERAIALGLSLSGCVSTAEKSIYA